MSNSGYELSELMDIAQSAAKIGGSLLLDKIHDVLEITTKGEAGNIVTDVDLAAEVAIRSEIVRRRPFDAITGEELEDRGATRSPIRWSIDPMDGTTNYARGNPYFCTSIAAIDTETNTWLVGVVNAPALNRLYFATRGGGAWLTTTEGTRQLHGPSERPGTRLLGLGFSYSREVRETQFAMIPELMSGFSDIRSLGSAALGLCEVADGRLDAFVETDLYEFDWAAGAVIAEESGVTVERPSGMRGGIRTALENVRTRPAATR
ncbi:inositol monophosphatase family protein [Salinibacterium sp. M195]|uniref:inositol monophosphatase family protein n=1 Tax=Salinibacterium sp. M195 TaxID=2583374 RepID=UPI001C63067A|nr:inositol monophosphatase family protein [Salinibacterium sp. M195]QYH35215.1 inositol monophosphatase [Salinibacterium sp. M195]